MRIGVIGTGNMGFGWAGSRDGRQCISARDSLQRRGRAPGDLCRSSYGGGTRVSSVQRAANGWTVCHSRRPSGSCDTLGE